VNFAASLVPVFCKINSLKKMQLKRKIFAICEHLFALSSVGSTESSSGSKPDAAASVMPPSSLSARLPSHSDLARLLLLGVQLSSGSHEYSKARTFASAGVSLLSSLDKSVTNDATVSFLHFQMHCDTFVSFINQNVTQGIDSEKMLLKQYSEGGSSRWCSGLIFSALLELSQSVNSMQLCHYHDAFRFAKNAFFTLDQNAGAGIDLQSMTSRTAQDIPAILAKCSSLTFWSEQLDSTCLPPTLTDVIFLHDAFERSLLPAISCGDQAILQLLSIHTKTCLNGSKEFPLSLSIIPIMKMFITASSQSVELISSTVLLGFVAQRLKETVPGLQVLQASLWTAVSVVPFASTSSIAAFVEAYSSVVSQVEVVSELTTQPFADPYNKSSLLASSHLLHCISCDLNDANEGDLCCTAQFFSAALVFISGCDISHLVDALAYNLSMQSPSAFGARLIGSLISVIQLPVLGLANRLSDAELLPDTFYFVILSIEALWNVSLGNWAAALITSKRASVLKMGPLLPLFQMNLSFCSCLARLQTLLAAPEDARVQILAEVLVDFESLFACFASETTIRQLHVNAASKDPVAKSRRFLSVLLAESSAYFDHPGGGMLQIICALFCEYLDGLPKDSFSCYENADASFVRDGLYLHSALACQLGHEFFARFCLTRQAVVAQADKANEINTLSLQEDYTTQLLLKMQGCVFLERSHALFSLMRFDTPALIAQQTKPSLAAVAYPDCPISKSSTYIGSLWFSGFVIHDRLLRMRSSLSSRSQGVYLHDMKDRSASGVSSLIDQASRMQSDLSRIQVPVPRESPVPALLDAAQIIGRRIGAQRAVVVTKTTTSVTLSATIQALAQVTFSPCCGMRGEDVSALCSQSPEQNLPQWLLKYGFMNPGVHIFQNISTSFGSNLLSEQEDSDSMLPTKIPKFPSAKKNSPTVRSMLSGRRDSVLASSARRQSVSSTKSEKTHEKSGVHDSGLSSVVMLSWGASTPQESEPHVSHLLWFEHRRILGVFGPDFYLNTLRCVHERMHPYAHPQAYLLAKSLGFLKAFSGASVVGVQSEVYSFSKKDIDDETHVTHIADRLPIVGVLWKRGSMIKNWKERHFQLFNTTLKYFTKNDKINALKSFEITHDTTILEVSEQDKKDISAPFEHCFYLMCDNRELYLCTDQVSRMKKWLKVLSSTIEHARKTMHASTETYAFNACVAPPSLNSISIIKRLGAGGFGEVFLASWNGLLVAVKKMTKELNANTLFRFRREADIMSVMRHPNILTYMACSLDPPNLMIVMEYMQYGSLFNVLQVG
jgi:hypothetical protein